MTFTGNWVDLLILIIFFLYLLYGLQRGFWHLTASLFSFLGSLLLALRFYPLFAKVLVTNFAFSYGWANAVAFFAVAIFTEAILGTIFIYLASKTPEDWYKVWWNKVLGVIPALLDAVIIVAFFLTFAVVLPISPIIKKDITSSPLGGYLVERTIQMEHYFKEIFGDAVDETLTFLTVKPQSDQRVDLRFSTKEFKVDEISETQMFAQVNEERKKQGLPELVWDTRLVPVARDHSKDMFSRGYFAHVSPEGKDVGDRLTENKVKYVFAGENLAYAPTLKLAHTGLMNSPGHRANILSRDFTKIGIGVLDGGIYGKMFTQVFTN